MNPDGLAPSEPADFLVSAQLFQCVEDFELRSGDTLTGFELVYETYGSLNATASNAVLICHALSGNHHAAGKYRAEDAKPGWWDSAIGPGKPIDTNRFFVVSLNNLGGCHGSTGPLSTNPATNKPYGPDFPTVTVSDWVRSQAILADHLGIHRFAAIIGGSLGGMQALQWSIDFPERLQHAVVIAAAPKLSAQNIAFNEIARHAITSDPGFCNGDYAASGKNPDKGLGIARMIGHVTYLSANGMGLKFGREIKSGDIVQARDVEFQVESYLQYQGQSFAKSFDANTYIRMTRALDYFDPAQEHGNNLTAALRQASAKFLVISFSSDWRFSPQRSQEIVDALVESNHDVVSTCIESEHGHDSFLLPLPRYFQVLGGYLDRVAENIENPDSHTRAAQSAEATRA